jgi:hypothetical protein
MKPYIFSPFHLFPFVFFHWNFCLFMHNGGGLWIFYLGYEKCWSVSWKKSVKSRSFFVITFWFTSSNARNYKTYFAHLDLKSYFLQIGKAYIYYKKLCLKGNQLMRKFTNLKTFNKNMFKLWHHLKRKINMGFYTTPFRF